MIEHYNLSDFNKHNLNTALHNITSCFPLQLHKNKRRIIKQDSTQVNTSFYFIADDITTKEQLNNKIDWTHNYFNFILPRVTKKQRANNGGERLRGVCVL